MNKRVKINDSLIVFYFFNMIIFTNGTIFSRIGKVAFVFLSFLYLITKNKNFNKLKHYYVWILTFILLCGLSTFWALNQNYAIDGTLTVLLNFLCIFMLSQLLLLNNNSEEIYLKSLFIIPTFLLIVLFLKSGTNIFSGLRSNSYNYNSIGMYCGLGIAFGTFYLLKYKKFKLSYIIFIIIDLVLLILTMSRKAILFLAMPLILTYLFTGNNLFVKLRKLFIAGILLILFYFAIMKVPFLHKFIGEGLQNILNYFLYSSGDISAAGRNTRIEFGLELYNKRPILGYGIRNYNFLFQNYNLISNMLFADNNYVDMLVNLGIVGFIAYYYIYLHTIIIFLKTKKKNNLNIVFPFTILLTLLISEYGISSYIYLHFQTYLFLAIYMIKTNLDNQKKVE